MTDALVLIDPAASTVEVSELSAPQLPVTDLSAHRGDGIFETVLVSLSGSGVTVVNRERHFTRFCSSASALGLPDPDPGLWDRALEAVIAKVRGNDPTITEFGVRYALSRGTQNPDGSQSPRGWAFNVPVDEKIVRARAQGISAVSLDRGYDAYLGSKAPWLLIGAKTLSYAVNQAAGRYAAEQGADEALFVSHDGVVLEGPTSNLMIRRGDRLLTPDPEAGLLSGTTQRLVFDHAAELGLKAEYADLGLSEVIDADGAWYVSSMRTAVTLSQLDRNPIKRDEELTAKLQALIMTG
ncbi:MAG: aminotransferase class IV [Brevibacterium sp.]|uniref:aminotransferase class IV n=1 Tax=Brevibacterium sp. TaxID=1701 RepID=UPI002649050A|nr:aminotransferase class IV [Brevibacterium sp.]MDN5806695.1 aminotransferase class IV [Brevibacterium sp.]MDN5832502.1 aminotransferase class IV [Brevibacterium sp.]MDN5875144.1 aminotransferase class IV [Brevibacterium sp.]MDN5908283.1 aminotransferase class IV [Brevibacterium sp.]MDN6132803.1 aminotransferase class IV [Brevibacterium sp.]